MSAAPVSVKTPADYSKESEKTSSQPCGICRRQFSRYTCPKCNLLYCSLQCFRHPNHADCSEAFYRKEVESDIRTEPSKTAEERKRMMDLLKRFEEDTAEDDLDLLGDEDSDDVGDSLTTTLANMDLDNVSYDDIWAALTPSQRDKFLRALNDPNSELAQQLLASGELESEIIEPWWECPSDDDAPEGSSKLAKRYGEKPKMMAIPPAVMQASAIAAANGPSLIYNIFAVLIAYAYVSRSLSISPLSSLSPNEPESHEARRLFTTLVPFLTDRKSKLVIPSLSGIITDLWSRFDQGAMTASFFAFLMRDASHLLRPSTIVPLSSSFSPNQQGAALSLEEHPSVTALLALSDISAFFEKTHPSKQGQNPVSAKVAFYAARVVATPTYILKALADEAAVRAGLIEREDSLDGVPQKDAPARRMKGDVKAAESKIVELT